MQRVNDGTPGTKEIVNLVIPYTRAWMMLTSVVIVWDPCEGSHLTNATPV
ncbi:MAG TPA: hypothetical protein VKQ08_02495 [Cyclobacteriaceae bacterium]|nr:hypothetical protein [Cyclobacteriaceae bacterium]